MTVSIVIAAYNREDYLPETIESVLAQTRSDWELVIVDDGSTDRTLAAAQTFAQRDRRIRVVHQENGGGAAARNRGMREIAPESQYVAFLDSDDTYEPFALEALVSALEADPQAVAAHGLARYIDSQSRRILLGEAEAWQRDRLGLVGGRLVAAPPEAPTDLSMLLVACRILAPGQGLIRQRALRQMGECDTSTTVADYDMWLRLAALGGIVFVDSVLLNYRQHGGQMMRQQKQVATGMRYARRKVLVSPVLTEAQRRESVAACLQSQRFHAVLRLQWARDHVKRRDYLGAIKQVRHAVDSYARYVGRVPV